MPNHVHLLIQKKTAALKSQYGIVNVMDVQNLEKKQRNKIIKELCNQGAGFRQLARTTGIS